MRIPSRDVAIIPRDFAVFPSWKGDERKNKNNEHNCLCGRCVAVEAEMDIARFFCYNALQKCFQQPAWQHEHPRLQVDYTSLQKRQDPRNHSKRPGVAGRAAGLTFFREHNRAVEVLKARSKARHMWCLVLIVLEQQGGGGEQRGERRQRPGGGGGAQKAGAYMDECDAVHCMHFARGTVWSECEFGVAETCDFEQ